MTMPCSTMRRRRRRMVKSIQSPSYKEILIIFPPKGLTAYGRPCCSDWHYIISMRFRQSLSQEQFDNSTIAFIPFDLRPSWVTINKLSGFVSAQFLLWRPCRARESGRETRSRRKMRRTIRYSVAALPPSPCKSPDRRQGFSLWNLYNNHDLVEF